MLPRVEYSESDKRSWVRSCARSTRHVPGALAKAEAQRERRAAIKADPEKSAALAERRTVYYARQREKNAAKRALRTAFTQQQLEERRLKADEDVAAAVAAANADHDDPEEAAAAALAAGKKKRNWRMVDYGGTYNCNRPGCNADNMTRTQSKSHQKWAHYDLYPFHCARCKYGMRTAEALAQHELTTRHILRATSKPHALTDAPAASAASASCGQAETCGAANEDIKNAD